MKKKVVTTLLSAMLSVSMAAAPVMAFDDEAASFEVTADDFGSEIVKLTQTSRLKETQKKTQTVTSM